MDNNSSALTKCTSGVRFRSIFFVIWLAWIVYSQIQYLAPSSASATACMPTQEAGSSSNSSITSASSGSANNDRKHSNASMTEASMLEEKLRLRLDQIELERKLKPEIEQKLRVEIEQKLRVELEQKLRVELEQKLKQELEQKLRVELEPKLKQELEQKQKLAQEQQRQQEEQGIEQEKEPEQNKYQDKEQDQELLRLTSCDAIVQRIHDWNNCWRRHLMTEKRSISTSPSSFLQKTISCPINVNNGNIVMETIGAPMYHFSFYSGQGFGRMVDHTALATSVAFVLKRPFLINLTPRDQYYTWRSFINQNTYHWDPTVLHSLPEYADELEDLAQKLPRAEVGGWKAAINASDYDTDEALVFPMNSQFKSWEKTVQYYHGTNPSRGNKVLFSPNWADGSWFGKIPTSKEILPNLYNCNYKSYKAMIQNAMYGPTDLTWQLHQQRYNKAMTALWDTQNNMANDAKTDPITTPSFSTSSISTDSARRTRVDNHHRPIYGTIHIRSFFINNKRKAPALPSDIAIMLQSCMRRASTFLLPDEELPQNWWILGDNATYAALTANKIHEQQHQLQQQTGTNNGLPLLKVFHDYNETIAAQAAAKNPFLSSVHSMSKDSTGLFGQEVMAGSIQDWMALYQSTISIVVAEGTFGTSGATGYGKVPMGMCDLKDDLGRFFALYMEEKEGRAPPLK